ncbi:hypothetical protein [Polymorphobacter fuscus]|uniref:SH3 domain-containing protein n=1 Tax=Sandarakinorhabdus fusca TaxID=1439888 RepID=A0A7C9KNL9_9SPHN|nr:hypothetical protein [Polymorphobacter fuscus]KAB7643920.1 hypothetical protein F9290_15325 [Polymorphobacter fuscus]MQT18623.1 hypothetical protein [Polymorphobacter fuscus]NJC07010.1 hypothetical protein [Polymorphobacter fuscus]
MTKEEAVQAALDSLDQAMLSLTTLSAVGEITSAQRDAAEEELQDQIDTLLSRLKTLRATGSGVTPLPDTKKVEKLQRAVAALGGFTAAAATWDSVIQTVVTTASALANAASTSTAATPDGSVALAALVPDFAKMSLAIAGGTLAESLLIADTVSTALPARQSRLFVTARSGLRVRSGPGTNFDVRPPDLSYGTAVRPIRVQDGWTLIDIQGDGKADGYVSSGFLADQLLVAVRSGGLGLAETASQTPDAAKISELVGQGSGAAGLKQARKTASRALSGYPTNGCAAHLSALLQQASINVDMTFGAGKLAHILTERNWRRVPCGQQAPGDVGVCFDNDPTPVGADHVYLVIETLGPDRMMIADNQNPKDAPHERFTSGRGKTPTEYFLRA